MKNLEFDSFYPEAPTQNPHSTDNYLPTQKKNPHIRKSVITVMKQEPLNFQHTFAGVYNVNLA